MEDAIDRLPEKEKENPADLWRNLLRKCVFEFDFNEPAKKRDWERWLHGIQKNLRYDS